MEEGWGGYEGWGTAASLVRGQGPHITEVLTSSRAGLFLCSGRGPRKARGTRVVCLEPPGLCWK